MPSTQPGKGSFQVLVTIAGRMITTCIFSLRCSTSISPIAFVNTYGLGHPYIFALIVHGQKKNDKKNHFTFTIWSKSKRGAIKTQLQ